MGQLTVLALRIVIVMVLTGSLFVQAVMVPLLAVDLDDVGNTVRVPVLVIVVLGIATRLRMLLTQAVALDRETHQLQNELDGVI